MADSNLKRKKKLDQNTNTSTPNKIPKKKVTEDILLDTKDFAEIKIDIPTTIYESSDPIREEAFRQLKISRLKEFCALAEIFISTDKTNTFNNSNTNNNEEGEEESYQPQNRFHVVEPEY